MTVWPNIRYLCNSMNLWSPQFHHTVGFDIDPTTRQSRKRGYLFDAGKNTIDKRLAANTGEACPYPDVSKQGNDSSRFFFHTVPNHASGATICIEEILHTFSDYSITNNGTKITTFAPKKSIV